MAPNRCARCGRERQTDLVGGDSTDLAFPLLSGSKVPWALFAGEVVCPDCQTPGQRREAALRTVAMIEREIERRSGGGIRSDPYEAAMIAYAMELRTRAEGEREQPAPEVDEGRQQQSTADGLDVRLRVALTGAFLTGHPIEVGLDDFETVQGKLTSELQPGWSTAPASGGGTYLWGGGFTRDVPLVVARNNGVEFLPLLSSAVAALTSGRSRETSRSKHVFQATPTSVTIEVYDLGVGVLTAWFEVSRRSPADVDAVMSAVKQLAWLGGAGSSYFTPVGEALQRIAFETTDQYGEAVRSAITTDLPPPWLSRGAHSRQDDGSTSRFTDERGRLLWLHPVYVLNASETAKARVEDLAATFHQTIEIEGAVFVAGIGSSAVVAWGKDAELLPVRLTELHWAYYALHMEIDRGLLAVLDRRRWRHEADLTQLEGDAEAVFTYYLRVMNARARLDSALSARGADEQAIWETIAKVQRFGSLVLGVERKLDVLDKVAKRRVDLATTARDRRIGKVLGALTVLTLLTVAITVMTVFLGSLDSTGTAKDRLLVIATASMCALLLYWFTFLRIGRPSRRGNSNAIESGD